MYSSNANFRRMFDEVTVIEEVKQKARIIVDGKGSEAAAVTSK